MAGSAGSNFSRSGNISPEVRTLCELFIPKLDVANRLGYDAVQESWVFSRLLPCTKQEYDDLDLEVVAQWKASRIGNQIAKSGRAKDGMSDRGMSTDALEEPLVGVSYGASGLADSSVLV